MNWLIFLCISLISTEVPVLNRDTFQKALQDNKYVFVNFQKSFCSHSIVFGEEITKVHQRMELAKDKIPIYEVNDESPEIFEQFNIQEFPTPILFIEGKPLEYKGPRFEYDMYSWLERVLHPTNNLITQSTELRIIKEMKVAVFLFINSSKEDAETQDLIRRFNVLRFKFDKFPMVYSFDKTLAEKESVTKKFGLVVYRAFDKPQAY